MITSNIKRPRVRACHLGLMSIGVLLLFFAANSLFAAVPTYRPHLTIKAGQATAFEDDSAEGVFVIERKGPTSDPVTVRLLIQGNATNGIDYETIPQEIQIPAGSSATEIRVTPINDTDAEEDETVTIGLADAPNTSTANKTLANVVIKDNDTVVQIGVVNPNGAEAGPQSIVYSFSRVGNLTSQLTVRFSVNQTQIRNIADGTSNTIQLGDGSVRTVTTLAAPGVDFQSLPTSVTFRSGQSDVQLNVIPIDDSTAESLEQVILRIVPDRVYQVGINSVAAGFIEDNDSDLATNIPAATVAVKRP